MKNVNNNFKEKINNITIKNSYLLSYLDSIKNIINNPDYSDLKKQEFIENSWVNIIKEKLENPKFLINSHSNKLYYIIKKEALDTLNLLYKNNNKKKFPFFSEELHKLEYLIVTYSIAVNNYSRLKLTAISNLVGENILYLIYKNRLKKSSNENFISYFNWKKELKIDLNDEIKIKLGYFYLTILSNYPQQILYFEYVKEENNTEYYKLNFNEEYLNYIKDNIIIPLSSLPMLCEPLEWSCKSFGGFLD